MTASATVDRRTSVDALAASLMVVLCLVWGLNQVAVKIVNHGLQPAFQAGLRSLFAAVLVYGWCLYRRVPVFGRDGTLGAGIVAGLLFGLEFALIYIGLDYTSVSRAIVFVYVAPFVVAGGAHFLIPGERLTLLRVVGLVAAFLGVVLILSDKLSLPSPSALVGDVLCLIAGVAWGATTLVIRTTKLSETSPEKVLLYQLAVSAVMLIGVAPLFGPLVRDFTVPVAGVFLFQVVVVAAASFLTWFWLLRRYPASQLSAFTFLTPVFGVALGGFLLSEPLSLKLVAALALVAAGIALVSRKTQ